MEWEGVRLSEARVWDFYLFRPATRMRRSGQSLERAVAVDPPTLPVPPNIRTVDFNLGLFGRRSRPSIPAVFTHENIERLRWKEEKDGAIFSIFFCFFFSVFARSSSPFIAFVFEVAWRIFWHSYVRYQLEPESGNVLKNSSWAQTSRSDSVVSRGEPDESRKISGRVVFVMKLKRFQATNFLPIGIEFSYIVKFLDVILCLNIQELYQNTKGAEFMDSQKLKEIFHVVEIQKY